MYYYLFSILCLSVSTTNFSSMAADNIVWRLNQQYFIYMLIILQVYFVFLSLTSPCLCVYRILVVSKLFMFIYFSCIIWSLTSFRTWTRPRWNWRLQAKIKLFPPVHRCGCLITWGHRWPQFLASGCTKCPSTYTQAGLCGGSWLGLAVQPAVEQWDAAQQYAN